MTEEGEKNEPFTHPSPRKKNKNKNMRRFTDEQIRSLESIFKSETKLEPRKKMVLARELGLQPRQIAIWFQNKRARWKSKQIEQDYRVLKANYDNLNAQFESLKKEKQSLLIQLQKLSDLLNKPQDEGRGSKDLRENSTDGGSDNGDTYCEFKTRPGSLNDRLDHEVIMYSDDDERGNGGYFGQEEEQELLNMGEQADGSIASPVRTCNFNSGGFFDQSCGSSNWWDFWT
ncbi:hypothetical protein F0562_031012 [Nyssa sinensis]|uniref:Homeobox-leucine zipper protein n=1 Tax=Nyssa sinensis TaxID=561372 RepID=A0A5J5ATE9_9ASTE|nr:hypothetical protein F0562_031012 [Nyssa sinensis]